ncbi:MAG: hypothetical protein QOG75_7116, partial [Mycobacterium sp.]|nr:hypothetical protein [Mycobacterium sp.]
MTHCGSTLSWYKCARTLFDDGVRARGDGLPCDQVPAYDGIRDVDHRRVDVIPVGGHSCQRSAQRAVQTFPAARQIVGPVGCVQRIGTGQQ